jgi:hypothetical protein
MFMIALLPSLLLPFYRFSDSRFIRVSESRLIRLCDCRLIVFVVPFISNRGLGTFSELRVTFFRMSSAYKCKREMAHLRMLKSLSVTSIAHHPSFQGLEESRVSD